MSSCPFGASCIILEPSIYRIRISLIVSVFWVSLYLLRFPEADRHDPNPLRDQECLPQQAPQHSDCVEHHFFAAIANADDDGLAQLVYRQGNRTICTAAHHPASCLFDPIDAD